MTIESGGDSSPRDNEQIIDVRFGATLLYYRERVGLSQHKLADKAGLDHSSMSRYENGGRHPTKETVKDLAFALGLTQDETDDILFSAGYAGENNTIPITETAVKDANALVNNPNVDEADKNHFRAIVSNAYAIVMGGLATRDAIEQETQN